MLLQLFRVSCKRVCWFLVTPFGLVRRVVRLEAKVEELTKRVDGLSKYMKDLYDYLQKEHRRPLI